MEKWLKEVGKRIVKCRKEAGIKAKDVAEKAEITATYLSRVEHGKIPGVSLEMIRKIAEAIPCSIKQIVGENEITIEEAIKAIEKYKKSKES